MRANNGDYVGLCPKNWPVMTGFYPPRARYTERMRGLHICVSYSVLVRFRCVFKSSSLSLNRALFDIRAIEIGKLHVHFVV